MPPTRGEAGDPGKIGRRPDKRAAAAEWLTQYLAGKGGMVAGGTVMEDAKHYGHAKNTIRRAADDMTIKGIVQPDGSLKEAKGGKNIVWVLQRDVLDVLGLTETLPPALVASLPGGDGP